MTRHARLVLLVALLALTGAAAAPTRASVGRRLNAGVEFVITAKAKVDAKKPQPRFRWVSPFTAEAPRLQSQTSAPSALVPIITLQLPPPVFLA